MSKDKLFEDIEKHCRDGVDFITVHCGVTKEVVRHLKEQGRITGIVSRGGSMLLHGLKDIIRKILCMNFMMIFLILPDLMIPLYHWATV